MLAAGFIRFPKIAKDTTRAVNTTTGRANQLEQSLMVLVAVGYGLVQPLIEPGPSNPQHFCTSW